MLSDEINVDVQEPPRYHRAQLLLRLALLALFALLDARAGWVFGALYLALPIVAAVSIQTHGARAFPDTAGRVLLRLLRWWTGFVAYMLLASDRFPASETDLEVVRVEVTPSGRVDFSRALFRLLTSLPEFVVVLLLGWLTGLLSLVAALSVLFVERVPQPLWRFQRQYVSLQARWFAYHASLVDAHPLIASRRLQPR